MGAILLIVGSILVMFGLSFLFSSVWYGCFRKFQYKVVTDDGGGHDHVGLVSVWLLFVLFVVIVLIMFALFGSFVVVRGS